MTKDPLDCPFCGAEAADWGFPGLGKPLEYHCSNNQCPAYAIVNATVEMWNKRFPRDATRLKGDPIEITGGIKVTRS